MSKPIIHSTPMSAYAGSVPDDAQEFVVQVNFEGRKNPHIYRVLCPSKSWAVYMVVTELHDDAFPAIEGVSVQPKI